MYSGINALVGKGAAITAYPLRNVVIMKQSVLQAMRDIYEEIKNNMASMLEKLLTMLRESQTRHG
jgi:L-lactate utilization protein LutB